MMGEITYPFPNLNGAGIEVWESINNFSPHFTPMWLKLNQVSKRGPWCFDMSLMPKFHKISGCTNYRWSTIVDHAAGAGHGKAALHVQGQRATEEGTSAALKTIEKLHGAEKEKYCTLLRTAHAIAKHGRPLSDFRYIYVFKFFYITVSLLRHMVCVSLAKGHCRKPLKF